MQLNKSGKDATLIAQDFTTILSNMNAALARIETLESEVAALQPVTQTPVINSANKVTTAGGIAVGSGISGDGTPEKPLTNTGIFSGVTLAASSALTGAGTVASPLAVNPDGTTVSINGSNKLTVVAPGLLLQKISNLTNTQVNGITNVAGGAFQLVAGIASTLIVPVYWTFEGTNGANAYGGAETFFLRWKSGGGTLQGNASGILGGANLAAGANLNFSTTGSISAQGQITAAAGATASGYDLVLLSNSGVGNTGGNGNSVRVTVYYVLQTPLF